MAIKQSTLRSSRYRFNQSKHPKSLTEAVSKNKKVAFLCHSHKDHDLAIGLQVLMSENGWDLYIDWQDEEMPETTNKVTASKIKEKITSSSLFIFLATDNSTRSRWCPWEIGFADLAKGYNQIFIIPTEDDYGRHYGNEYLQLYKRVDVGSLTGKINKSGYAVFEPSAAKGTWVDKYPF